MARRRRRRRRGKTPWRLLLTLLLIAGAIYWTGRGLLSLEGRYWTAQNFWRGSPTRVKLVVEEALAQSAAELGIEPPYPQLLCEPDSTGITLCEGIVILPPGMTTIQGNVHFTRALTGLGLDLLDGLESSDEDMVDIIFGAGSKTQILVRLAPAPPAATDSSLAEPGRPPVPIRCRIALVIDDFGMSGTESVSRRFEDLPGIFTAAIIPGMDDPQTWAERAREMGMEVILNLPLEPKNYPVKDPGKYAIHMDYSGRRIRKIFQEGVKRVGEITGVKTYMGSLAIEDRDVMRPILEEVKDRDLFFLDSTREQYSVAPELGREIGVPVLTLWKSSLVDQQYKRSTASIGIRLDDLVKYSRARGYGIGVIHAQSATLEVLADRLPGLARQGVVVVGLSSILESRKLDSHPTRDDRSRKK